MNMCKTFGAAVLAVGLSGASTHAAVVLSDNFDGYTNSNLSGQGGWTITGTPPATPNPIQVAGDVDKYAQMSTGQDEYKAFTSAVPHTDGNSIVTSFSANVSATSTFGDYFSHLSSPVGTSSGFYQRFFARSSGDGFQFGLVDISGTGSTVTYGTGVLTLGAEYDVDITWNFVSGGNNDTFAVTVDGSPYLTHTWTSATAEPGTLEAVNLRQGSTSGAPTLQFDDYVVTEVLAIPEPTAVAALGLGALGMLRRRRSR